jgi:transmembrane sensor
MKGAPIRMPETLQIIDQAIDWHVRLADGSDADWVAFVEWLEASPAHAAAYDTVALQDRAIENARFPDPMPVASNDNPPRRTLLWAIGGTGIAAVIAALLVSPMMTPRASPYEIATRAGEQRTIALDDGTSIDLSGGTTVRLDHADARVATLERGEALFHVRHDDKRPFTLTTNGMAIRDLGTVFNVARNGDRAITLKAGDALVSSKDGGIERSHIAPEMVGGWRSGTLNFEGQSLGEVAATLKRLYAIDLRIDGSLSARPFTGMIRFTGEADRDVPHLAALIGANWRRDGERWILSEGAPVSR